MINGLLHAYGCSWTEGEGSYVPEVALISNREDKKIFRNQYSWPRVLANHLGIRDINNGIGGNANLKIFNSVVQDLRYGKISQDDLVVIMWSSSLRDYVPFLPRGEWVSWSVKHLVERPDKFILSYRSDDERFDSFFQEYKKMYVGHLYNKNYYNIVNQNYIIFLQEMFKAYKIRYIMAESFDPMLLDVTEEDDRTYLIDSDYYWGFKKQNFRDFLNRTKRIDVWEYQDATYEDRPTQHPNQHGYKLIGDELYNFIKERITL
jgi:hypothetical protein